MRLRVCAAAMTTTPIHRSNIHRKWVKAPNLVDAERHGEILHPSSRNHPMNGCLREGFQFIIQVERIGTSTTNQYRMRLYPSCKRTKLKTAVWSTPARKQAESRIDETDLFRRQVDDAERITATGIMINISKQHVETSHGIKKLGYD